MTSKVLTAKLEAFVEHINKKNKKHNGLKIRYAFVNRKRRGGRSLASR